MNITTQIAGINLKTPVIVSSGTFGYGYETKDIVPVSKIGAITTKTITLKPRQGNPPPRIAEVENGILNTIGLQNVGIDKFLQEKWPQINNLNVPIFVSIAGETSDEFIELVNILSKINGISAIELNLSCPNLQKQIICQNQELVETIIVNTSRISTVPIIAKLSPHVPNLGHLANICENAGAHIISVANTFQGMAIDINTRKPKLSTITGGMSGPAIKPLALKCVWEVYNNVKIPIIGGGGISTGNDAIEFMLAGAKAVSIGTANFTDSLAPIKIADEIKHYLKRNNLITLEDVIAKLIHIR